MQTFLPEADFDETAKHLDRKRLIKQSVENLQILKSLAGLYSSGAWAQFDEIYQDHFMLLESDEPWWLGDNNLHYTHKGRLFEKDPEKYYFYSDYSDFRELGYTCCDSCSYYWPTHAEAK